MFSWRALKVLLVSALFVLPLANAASVTGNAPASTPLGDDPKIGGHGCG